MAPVYRLVAQIIEGGRLKLDVPQELLYSKDHEWVKVEGSKAYIGITGYAQNALGDIVFVELPAEGAAFAANATFGVVESVKAASDLYLPISGTILETNAALESNPELLNQDSYTNWIVVVEIANINDLAALLTAEQYGEIIK